LDVFIKNNPDEQLDKNEFKNLYCQLQGWKKNENDINEKLHYADKPCEFIFKLFDCDNNEKVSFREFLVCE
jgi:Ca2+-binding EF-hand superfamily protein